MFRSEMTPEEAAAWSIENHCVIFYDEVAAYLNPSLMKCITKETIESTIDWFKRYHACRDQLIEARNQQNPLPPEAIATICPHTH